MNIEYFNKARELVEAIEKVKKLINSVNNPYAELVTFYSSGSQGQAVTDTPEDLAVIRAVLLGLHTTRLAKLETELKAL